MTALVKVTSVLVLIYVAYMALLFVTQRRMVFPVHLIPAPTRGDALPVGVEQLWMTLPFGKVESWFVRGSGGSERRPLVIFAHGNGELIDYWPEEARHLARLGVSVLLVEYPGYGRSSGAPSKSTIDQTLRAAWDHVVRRPDVDPDRIILIGRSLGGGAVTQLARDRPARALVLISTFTDARSFARRFFVPGVIVRDPFENLQATRSFGGPVLVVHGRYDDIVPYTHGMALAEAASEGELLTLECGHNDCPLGEGFWQRIHDFLRRRGILDDPSGNEVMRRT